MTLNGRNVLLNKIYGAHHKNVKEVKPMLSAAKCRPMIVVSESIRHTPILEGVPLIGDDK